MGQKLTYLSLFFIFYGLLALGQDVAYNDSGGNLYQKAYQEAIKGQFEAANSKLVKVVDEHPDNREALILLARSYSWAGEYGMARGAFNRLTSQEKNDSGIWISAIKNELYARKEATALGLANKALTHLKGDTEIKRLKEMAIQRIEEHSYPELGWFNQNSEPRRAKAVTNNLKSKKDTANTTATDSMSKKIEPETIVPKTPVDAEVQNNRLSIRNAFTVFDQRYDPIIASSVSYKRQTMAGSIIPRINYNNRRGIHGLQYDLDFYPKFSKRFYAYLNYGYSNASIYPNHKVGGDLYANLPWAMEFSAGGRYIDFETKNVSVITNSLGHYRGNYYFSLRSYITPLPDRLTRISGNLLVRKYLRDAENYMGINLGLGYSPELRQLTSGDELLAETLLYVESQRLSLEYQFTGKKNPNVYRANMGVTRQELAFDSGNYFWSINAGLTYQVKF